jgi:hypothetical protein
MTMQDESLKNKGAASITDFMLGAISCIKTEDSGFKSTILPPLPRPKEKATSILANPGAPFGSVRKVPLLGMFPRLLKKLQFWKRDPSLSLSLGKNFPALVYPKMKFRHICKYTLKNQRGDLGIGEFLGSIYGAIAGFMETAYIGVNVGTGTVGFWAADVIYAGAAIGASMLLSSAGKTKKPSSMASGGLLICRRQG